MHIFKPNFGLTRFGFNEGGLWLDERLVDMHR
jgi:hypothetical protein